MLLRSPKRIYTQAALEAWFERLASDWEEHFDSDILQAARNLYLSGDVRELELGATDAIVHTKRNKQALYSLVEWENGRPVVRTSTVDRRLGDALAVAGLYEIEELVADEILPVPEEPREKKGAASEAVAEDAENAKPDEAVEEPARALLLRFTSIEQGLVFDACWAERGKDPQPALLHGKRHVSRLASGEREMLIRLTGMAHQSGFEFWAHSQNYIMRDLARIPTFLRKSLPQWKERFLVETDEGVKALAKGVQTVQVEAEAGGRNGSLKFRWKLRLGGKLLSDEQVEKLLKRCRRATIVPELGLVRLNEEQAAVVEGWQPGPGYDENGELPKYLIFSLFGQENVKIDLSDELKQWHSSLLKDPSGGRNGLPEILRPYQRRGVEWLKHLCSHDCHMLLADEMGLGKTLQVAALIQSRPIEGKSHLVVCPASVVPVWKNEIGRHFPDLRVETLKSGHTFIEHSEPAIWLTSYTQLRRQKNLLDEIEFGYAILDEGQQIKNPDAKVTVACMNIRACHRIVLTGTPLENRHLDLWTLFRFLMPGLLGSRRVFTEGLEKEGEDFLGKLSRQVAPFILRRTKKDVARELPDKVEMELTCPLTHLQESEYKRLAETGLEALGDDFNTVIRDRSMSLFTLLTRLRQVCCDPGLLPWLSPDISSSGKFSSLADKVSEVTAGGHKVVIFSQFVRLLNRVRAGFEERCPQVPIFELTGKTTDREKPVAEFQKTRGAAMILVSLRAGGTGVTLHAADYVFLLDPWWNPAVEEQAVDRVHRIGQDKTVFVYRMVTAGTIEERIERLKAAKKEMFDEVVGGLSDVSDFRNHFRSLSELIALNPAGDEASGGLAHGPYDRAGSGKDDKKKH